MNQLTAPTFDTKTWLRTAWSNNQIKVFQNQSDSWVVWAPTDVLDQFFHFLVNRADSDKEERFNFLVGDLMDDGSNTYLIDSLFAAVARGQDLTEAKRHYALDCMQRYVMLIMNWSGAADYASAEYKKEMARMNADAERARG